MLAAILGDVDDHDSTSHATAVPVSRPTGARHLLRREYIVLGGIALSAAIAALAAFKQNRVILLVLYVATYLVWLIGPKQSNTAAEVQQRG